jgi:hypothetical protein
MGEEEPMSYKGCVVTFERDLSEADYKKLSGAIEQLCGVVSVDPVSASAVDRIDRIRIRNEFREMLWEVLWEK